MSGTYRLITQWAISMGSFFVFPVNRHWSRFKILTHTFLHHVGVFFWFHAEPFNVFRRWFTVTCVQTTNPKQAKRKLHKEFHFHTLIQKSFQTLYREYTYGNGKIQSRNSAGKAWNQMSFFAFIVFRRFLLFQLVWSPCFLLILLIRRLWFLSTSFFGVRFICSRRVMWWFFKRNNPQNPLETHLPLKNCRFEDMMSSKDSTGYKEKTGWYDDTWIHFPTVA